MRQQRAIVTAAFVVAAALALACGGPSGNDDNAPGGNGATSEAAKAPGSVGDGTFAVGSDDMKAGTYQANVPENSTLCYWEISKDDKGTLESIIANDNLQPKAHGLVVVADGQFFKNSGCGGWAPATDPATPANTMTEGTYRVGIDVAEGTYTADVPADSTGCYWSTSTDGTGSANSIVANENLTPGAHGRVSVTSGQWFKTTGCGTWTAS